MLEIPRTRSRIRIAVAWIQATASIALVCTGLAHAKESLRKWADGPVRYLLTPDERRTWKSLDDDGKRQEFIHHFWAKRDPVPSTPTNEALIEFERRVAEADARCRSEGGRGWLTDRGRILILWGSPDEEREDALGSITSGPITSSGEGGGGISSGRRVTRGRITWTYRQPPDPDASPNTVLVFEADERGKYRLTTQIDPSWALFATTQAPAGQNPATGEIAAGAKRDAPPPRPPTEGPVLELERARLGELTGLDVGALAFPVGRDEAYVVVPFAPTPATRLDGVADVAVAVWRAGDARPGDVAVLPYAPADGAGPRSFALLLSPGRHLVALAARDAGGVGRHGGTVELDVPDFTDGALKTSSVVLATGISNAGGDTVLGRLVEGVVVGSLKLDARPGNGVGSGQTPEAVFFISGGQAAADGSLAIAADYRILRGEDPVRVFPTQTLTSAIIAQPVPLTGLSSGDYRLEIKLHDRGSDATFLDHVAFRID